MTQANPAMIDPPVPGTPHELEMLVRRTRQRWLLVATLCGVAWLVTVGAGSLLAGAAVDLLMPLPVPLRVTIATLVAGSCLAVLVAAVLRPLVRPPRLLRVAQQIEATVPGMHNRLISVLDLCRADGKPHLNDPFLRRLVEQTGLKLQRYRVEQVVSLAPLQRSALLAGSTVMLGLAMAFTWPDRVPTALHRLLQPTAPIPPAAWVRYDVQPGNARALQGDPITIRAVVTRGDPMLMTLRLRQPGGTWAHYPMDPQVDGSYAFTISSLTSTQQYQVVGGGTWSLEHEIQMVRRPMVEQVRAAVLLPSYMAITEPQPVPDDARQISAPMESQIELIAKVSGDAQEGRVLLHRAADSGKATTVAGERQMVWIDDQTPGDAELDGRWRWESDEVYSGSQCWELGPPTPACAFSTRLARFALPAEHRLFLYVRPDAEQTPGRFRVVVKHSDGESMFVWDSPAAPAPDELKAKARVVGPLPKAGDWTRLEIPVAWLGNPAGVELQGLTFQVDRGRMRLDRVGAVAAGQVQENDAQEWTLVESFPMRFDVSAGAWRGTAPVRGDGAWSLAFTGSLGHPSPAMKPMPILATTDAPPALNVEKPGRDVTLAAPEPLPVMVRVFDDYGIGSIGMQTGASADKLDPVQWLASYDDPQRSRLLLSVLDPAVHSLKAGQTLHYRLVVRDRKDQQVVSPTYKLAIAAAQTSGEIVKPKSRAELRGLLDGLGRLVNVQNALAQTIGQLVRGNDAAADGGDAPPPTPLVMTHPDGTPMTAQEVRQAIEKNLAALPPQQQQELQQQIDQQLADRREAAQELSEELQAMAQESEQSPLAMPDQAPLLAAMAQQVGQWAQEQPATLNADAMAQSLAQTQQQWQQQQQAMQQMQSQLQQMQQAQQQMTQDAELARQQMQMLLAQQQAAALQRQLQEARGDIAHRQEQWQALGQEMEELWSNFDQAPQEAEAQARHQAQLQEQLAQMMQRNRELLQQPPAPLPPPPPADPAAAQPPAPPPPRQPAPPPQLWAPPQDEADTRPEDGPPPQIVEQMQKQRQQMRQSLQDHDRELEQGLQQMDHAGEDMSRLLDQLGTGPGRPPQPSDAAQNPSAAAPSPMSPAQAIAALQQMGQSPTVRWAQGVAYRAMLQQMASGAMAGRTAAPAAGQASPQQNPGGSSNGGQAVAMPGQVFMVEMDPTALQSQQRAAVYRLPPKLREPLLQGMTERGPDGYQDLIDAYFRQLSDEVAKP